MSADQFAPCATCPDLVGCGAAFYCVQERRFHSAGRVIAIPAPCGACGRSVAEGGWACAGSPDPAKPCEALSELWAMWFLVRMYAFDEQRRIERADAGVVDEPGDVADDYDDEPCYHEHDEECEDEWGYLTYCRHQHCPNCGGCQCPGYCDDYQTYNLRPAETGGESE